MATVVAFNVSETLVDLRALDPHFERLFGSAALRAQWFAQMLQLSFVGGLTDQYVDFSTAQQLAMRMLGQSQGVAISDEDVLTMGGSFASAVALVNSVESVGEAQLTNAGIRGHFTAVVSADSMRRLKPAREPYNAVAHRFGVPNSDVWLVAEH